MSSFPPGNLCPVSREAGLDKNAAILVETLTKPRADQTNQPRWIAPALNANDGGAPKQSCWKHPRSRFPSTTLSRFTPTPMETCAGRRHGSSTLLPRRSGENSFCFLSFRYTHFFCFAVNGVVLSNITWLPLYAKENLKENLVLCLRRLNRSFPKMFTSCTPRPEGSLPILRSSGVRMGGTVTCVWDIPNNFSAFPGYKNINEQVSFSRSSYFAGR